MDAGQVEEKIEAEARKNPNRLKAIMPVHIYGHPVDMDPIREIAQRHGLLIIEDAAEAIGSVWHGRRAGSMGLFGTFSFHGSKTITTGEGGMLVTSDAEFFHRVRTLSNHGRAADETRQFWPEVVGFKYKMANVQAAIGCAQLERIDELVREKRRVFLSYSIALAGLPLQMNPEPAGTVNGFWMPTIVVNEGVHFDRERLLRVFEKQRIDGRGFFWPLSSLPMFTDCVGGNVSKDLHRRALNLPSYHDLADAEINEVVACVAASVLDSR